MYNVRLCLLLLQYFAATFAIPTPTRPGLILSLPSTNSTSSSTNTTNLLLPNLPPLSDTILFPIPDSTITLGMNERPDQPIPPDDLIKCLYATSTRVLDDIRLHGDGPLQSIDDPFKSDPFPDTNCTFAVRSWNVQTPQGKVTNLTYGIVYTVLSGLLEYMLFPDPHYYSISFTVRDAEKGMVGVGTVGTARKR